MRYDLAALVRRRSNPRRHRFVMRDIPTTASLASDLYRAGYADIIAAWVRAIPAIMSQYERALAGMVRDDATDLGQTIEAAEDSLSRVVLLLRPALQRWALSVERWHRGKWRGAVLSATGVDIGTMIGPEDVRGTIGAAIERNVALVKSVSDEARGRISEAVFRGLNQRRAARDVATDIRAAVSMSRARALRIASDQTVKIASALDQERRREAGLDAWEWRHSGKKHPRADHVARNGVEYTDTDAPADLPGELPFCGCTSRAVLNLE